MLFIIASNQYTKLAHVLFFQLQLCQSVRHLNLESLPKRDDGEYQRLSLVLLRACISETVLRPALDCGFRCFHLETPRRQETMGWQWWTVGRDCLASVNSEEFSFRFSLIL